MERLYAVLGEERVSPDIEVCTCPVCMPEEMRLQIIATDRRELTGAQIGEYTASAHEVPADLSDLAVLLPRYIDLKARDMQVDFLGVGMALFRFGQAIRQDPGWLSAEQAAAYHAAAGLILRHAALRAGAGSDDPEPALHLLDVFATGGVPVHLCCAALDAAFDDPDHGPPALAEVCISVQARPIRKHGSFGLDLYGVSHGPASDREAIATWLASDAMQTRIDRAYLSDHPSLDEARTLALEVAMTMFPRVDAGLFRAGQTGARPG